MSKVVIIADDLTGANATSVLLARQGFKAATFLDLNKYNPEENKSLDVISISTDSRGIDSNTAYERVKKVADFFKDEDVKMFSKRIDSTLRGNVGSEIAAVLDSLSGDTVAIVVPAFPSSGRVCIGGYLMVHQVPLEKTDVAKDPKTPVTTSRVATLVEKQIKEKVGFIELDRVLKGVESISNAIINEKENGCKVIIVDATTDDDISRIAKAVKHTGLDAVAVDPGPFTAALAGELLGEPKTGPGQKVMVTVGSVSNLTRKQIDELRVKHSPYLVSVDAKKLIYDDYKSDEIERVLETLQNGLNSSDIIGVVTTGSEDEVLNLKEIAQDLSITEDMVSQRIADGLALITRKMLDRTGSLIGGLFTSGGDVTVAVCRELQTAGIEVKDEVLPLAVYGRLTNGKYENKAIITKGGLVGDDKAIIKCVDYLLTKLSNEYHAK